MNRDEILQRLHAVEEMSSMKLSPNACLTLNEALGRPDKNFRSIHVAGTNGKGSVVTKIAKGLEHAGYSVGLFTSPHITTYRERIQINGKLIHEGEVARLLGELYATADGQNIFPSFFETMTLLAFLYFSEREVDFAVIETGLGGRLDATNCITPELSVITSISLDHTHLLGDTVEKITREKGGIIKPDVPVIIGPTVPEDVVREIAKEKNAPLKTLSTHFLSVDEENSAIAKAALHHFKINPLAIEKGVQSKPPCRMEELENGIILDGAHNPEGLRRLFKTLKEKYPQKKIEVVFALSRTKDVAGCLQVIKKHATFIHLPEINHKRLISAKELEVECLKLGISPRRLIVGHPVEESIKKIKEEGCLMVVCGSFFMMETVRAALVCDS